MNIPESLTGQGIQSPSIVNHNTVYTVLPDFRRKILFFSGLAFQVGCLYRFFLNLILRFAIARHDLSLALSILECQGIEGNEAIAILRTYGGMANG